MKPVFHIAIGIIFNSEKSHIFITQRASTAHRGGYWEFAGGKVESGETAEQAVIRELNEEVGILVQKMQPFMALTHEYEDKILKLDFFTISAFEGEPYGRENQPSQWIDVNQLGAIDFPEGNTKVIEALLAQYGSTK